MAYIGLFASLALLIWFALRGVNIVFASLLCAILVAITNQLDIAEAIMVHFALGDLSMFNFAGKFFILFAAGALFGRVMGESKAAESLAIALIHKLGSRHVLLITTLACALLTYGGVVVFVVIFAIYPLGLRMLKESDTPKRLFCAAAALGAGTFTLTALPGTPSIQNIIPTLKLGTDLFAAPLLGLIGGAMMLVMGLWYLEGERRKAIAADEHFDPNENDKNLMGLENRAGDIENLPPVWLSVLPLIFVLGTIIAPRLIGGDSDLIAFANSQKILWPSMALFGGSLLTWAIMPHIRKDILRIFSDGTQDSLMPLLSTAAVIGFGGVVVQTVGFQNFSSLMLDSGLPPKLSLFASISVVSGITGSASGGLGIFMNTMADSYLALGIPADELHRIVVMAAGGFDSLPHCGAVVALLTITGLTHKQAYKDVGIITVVIPVIATLTMIGLSAFI